MTKIPNLLYANHRNFAQTSPLQQPHVFWVALTLGLIIILVSNFRIQHNWSYVAIFELNWCCTQITNRIALCDVHNILLLFL